MKYLLAAVMLRVGDEKRMQEAAADGRAERADWFYQYLNFINSKEPSK